MFLKVSSSSSEAHAPRPDRLTWQGEKGRESLRGDYMIFSSGLASWTKLPEMSLRVRQVLRTSSSMLRSTGVRVRSGASV
ncbi:MAG: hypothetical protein QOI57_2626 [Rubrobacteraceae bacterium]|nr:hypothetical protein [Rubrobacteraceae bacterium]